MSATDHMCKMDEANLTKDVRKGNCKTGAEWLNLICKSQEKDLLEIIKHQPELIKKTIELECLAADVDDRCNCCYEFESMKHLVEKDVDQLQALVETGRCQHVPDFRTADETEIDSSQDLLQLSSIQFESRETFQEKITIRNMQFYSMHETEDLPSNDTEANNEYKFRDPLDFNLLRQAWISLFLPRDRVMEGSGIVKAGVTVIHIAAALGYSKLVRKILKIADQSRHSTLHYRLLPLFHSIIYFQVDVTGILIKTTTFENVANFTRYYMLAVMRNNVAVLASFVENVSHLKHPAIPSYSFVCMDYQKQMGCAVAVRYKCHQSLEYLCSKLTRKKFATQIGHYKIERMPLIKTIEDTDLKNITVDNDILSLRCLLKFKDLFGTLLRYAVYYDRKDMAKILISEIKKEKTRIKSENDFNHLVVAVLNNSGDMLQILLDGYDWLPSDIAYVISKNIYTSHTWAVVLDFQNCVNVLQKTDIPYQEDTVARFPPLVAVFGKHVDSHVNNRLKLINILLRNGWSLFCETRNGVSPLFMALKSELYDFVRPLVRSGIDPFRRIDCLRTFMSRRLLGELVSANVDIFESKNWVGQSLLREILYKYSQYREYQPDICFLLRFAHTIRKENMSFILSARENSMIPEIVKDDIDDFLDFLRTPRTLEAMARDSLRRHYGTGIAYFLTHQVPDFPQKLKSIIMLENCLQHYLGKRFIKSKHRRF